MGGSALGGGGRSGFQSNCNLDLAMTGLLVPQLDVGEVGSTQGLAVSALR